MPGVVASPLRYPGGKSCLIELVSAVLRKNDLQRCHYVEPYAGGCGLALSLLYGGHVSDIYINDIDAGIWSFWKATLDRTEELVDLVETCTINLNEWHKHREIHSAGNTSDPLTLGFATFFLNRTNRSGVIKGAGVIGGLAQQGVYKIDCRFNKPELIRRIRRASRYRDRIHLSRLDAITCMEKLDKELPETAFFCIDPPYFNKGASLYTNFYGANEHQEVATAVNKLGHRWIVTYDDAEEIHNLYRARQRFLFSLNYSLQTKRVGAETLVASKRLSIPSQLMLPPTGEDSLPRLRLTATNTESLFV